MPIRLALSRTRPLLIAGLAAAVTLAAAAPADARSFALRATGSASGLGQVQAIGGFKRSVDPRLRARCAPTAGRTAGAAAVRSVACAGTASG